MVHLTAFAASTPLPSSRSRAGCVPHRAPRCTLAPERPSHASGAAKGKSAPKTYRVLSADLPEAERPPLPPKHRSIPAVGFLVEQLLGRSKSVAEMRRTYGPVYRADHFVFPQTYVASYRGASDVLNDPAVFLSGGAHDGGLALFGTGVVSQLDGAAHTKARALLGPAFAARLMPAYAASVLQRTEDMWAQVHSDARKRRRLEPVVRAHYLGVVVEVTTGVAAGSEASRRLCARFATVQRALFSPSFGPVWDAGMRAAWQIRGELADLVRRTAVERADTIAELRAADDDAARSRAYKRALARDGVHVLLVAVAESGLPTDAGAALDSGVVDELCTQLMLLWFAGYTTSAVTTLNALFEAGWDGAARAALVVEQDTLVAAAGGDRQVAHVQLADMPALDAYLAEVGRTRPPVAMLFRRTACDVELHGRYLPAGTLVHVSVKAAHADPDAWADPERFDPARARVGPPLLTFGGTRSPHYCVGAAMARMMMKTTLATLLREYEYDLDPAQPRDYVTLPEEVPRSGVVLRALKRR